MSELNDYFEDRLTDVNAYIEFLESLDRQISHSGTQATRSPSLIVTPQQQKILYSSVYIQLYNLVESTINQSIDLIRKRIIHNNLKPHFLREELFKEWIKITAKTHVDMSDDTRLKQVLDMCEYFINDLSISDFDIQIGGGGNWDDEEIYKLSKKIGLELILTQDTIKEVKRHFKDNEGVVACIKNFRNKLAHGNISFSECGEDLDIERLKKLKETTAIYLREVVENFSSYIENERFLSTRTALLEIDGATSSSMP